MLYVYWSFQLLLSYIFTDLLFICYMFIHCHWCHWNMFKASLPLFVPIFHYLNCGWVHPVAHVSWIKYNKITIPHSQPNSTCIYSTHSFTTCFGFDKPSSGISHIQDTKHKLTSINLRIHKTFTKNKRVKNIYTWVLQESTNNCEHI
jgi:hypothetical protein